LGIAGVRGGAGVQIDERDRQAGGRERREDDRSFSRGDEGCSGQETVSFLQARGAESNARDERGERVSPAVRISKAARVVIPCAASYIEGRATV
jgi:hypothetical protein